MRIVLAAATLATLALAAGSQAQSQASGNSTGYRPQFFDPRPRIAFDENPFSVYLSPLRKPDATDPLWGHVIRSRTADIGWLGVPEASNAGALGAAHKVDPNRPPVEDKPLAKLDHGLCYTLRMYKVKPTEHFGNGEGGVRGYSTCESASRYEVRSAIAHPQPAKNSAEDGGK
jgi:hypothetical protein